MQHKSIEQLIKVAEVRAAERVVLSRRDRLERWAALLAAEPERRLRSLGEIEFSPRADRPRLRADNSPLAVAFSDPVLRAEGLASDELGDGMAFFGLSERAAHRLLCSCMNGWSMAAGGTALKVRRLAEPKHRAGLAGLAVAAAVAGPLLVLLLS